MVNVSQLKASRYNWSLKDLIRKLKGCYNHPQSAEQPETMDSCVSEGQMLTARSRRSPFLECHGQARSAPSRLCEIGFTRSSFTKWVFGGVRLVIVLSVLQFCKSIQDTAAIVLKETQGDKAEWNSDPTHLSPPSSAFVESLEAEEKWYALRTNKPLRILRLTAAPEDRQAKRKLWYEVLVNFKPSVLKLSPDSKQ